ncbi:MAG TPA: GGDEF domain-containing protein [Pseudonocardia sp.]|nr:GGDEF domain-containing protein [Pseudonocardia sp.]
MHLLAAAMVVGGALSTTPTDDDLVLSLCLVVVATVHTEVATGIERVRRRVAERTYFDLSSVWTFAAAVLLPPLLVAVVVLVVYLHLWLRVWKPAKSPMYRHAFSTATVLLAAQTTHHVSQALGGVTGWPDDLRGLGAIVLAVVLYQVVNTVPVVGVLALTQPQARTTELLGHWDDNVLETTTLSLGALTAIALAVNPWLVVLVLPPLLVLHRAVHVRGLEKAASTDGKTGLLNAAAWHSWAGQEVRRAQRARTVAGVLIVDLDHFKSVNDGYGHIAGDVVLAAVARTLRAAVRDHDMVGRFGGEEFVVLLPDLHPSGAGRTELLAVGERIRRRISELDVVVETPDGPLTVDGLTTSVGGALHPVHGASLEQVLTVADSALYAAKRGGRNLVRIAPAPEPQLPATGPVPSA